MIVGTYYSGNPDRTGRLGKVHCSMQLEGWEKHRCTALARRPLRKMSVPSKERGGELRCLFSGKAIHLGSKVTALAD